MSLDDAPLMEPGGSLHVCNLANVAYGYCKILRGFGHPVSLRCHDLKHVMSQPEWEDLELAAESFPDETDFYSNSADFGSYKRPEWYHSAPLLETLSHEFDAGGGANSQQFPAYDLRRVQAAALRFGWRQAARIKQHLPLWAKARLAPRVFGRMIQLSNDGSAGERARLEQWMQGVDRRIAQLAEEARSFGPEWALSPTEIASYRLHAYWLARAAVSASMVVSYVLAPIYAMLLGRLPSVSVEIGTMREIPFDGTVTGRLLAMAYRKSDFIIITNPDVRAMAERLGVERYGFCPHPVDESVYTPTVESSQERTDLLERYGADYIAFAPARQNWRLKGNDRYLRALAAVVRQGIRMVLLIPAWGQEIERSKALCRELGLERNVVWLPPQSEKGLVKFYRSADFVLDQFTLGVFGLTTPKALAAGAVVLTSYNSAVNNWCFPKPPPLVACETADDIASAMLQLAANREARMEIGHQSREWIMRYHSRKVVARNLEQAMEEATQHFMAHSS